MDQLQVFFTFDQSFLFFPLQQLFIQQFFTKFFQAGSGSAMRISCIRINKKWMWGHSPGLFWILFLKSVVITLQKCSYLHHRVVWKAVPWDPSAPRGPSVALCPGGVRPAGPPASHPRQCGPAGPGRCCPTAEQRDDHPNPASEGLRPADRAYPRRKAIFETNRKNLLEPGRL